jgi:hypothetical protein
MQIPDFPPFRAFRSIPQISHPMHPFMVLESVLVPRLLAVPAFLTSLSPILRFRHFVSMVEELDLVLAKAIREFGVFLLFSATLTHFASRVVQELDPVPGHLIFRDSMT